MISCLLDLKTLDAYGAKRHGTRAWIAGRSGTVADPPSPKAMEGAAVAAWEKGSV